MSDPAPETPENLENSPTSSEPLAAAVVDTSAIDCYECVSCGYTYDPTQGDSKGGIEPETPFDDLSIVWRCPVCGARKAAFKNVGPRTKASGFAENLGYGFGVNTMTPSQKNVLIFTALALGVVFFLSLYTLN
jgi:rubredoxin